MSDISSLQQFVSDRREVEKTLKLLAGLVKSDEFDAEKQFVLIRSGKKRSGFSTEDTLLALEFDAEDVLKVLCELSTNEYSHSLLDRDDANPPILYVFGKVLSEKLVYIKFKIRSEIAIICVSFHFAEHEDMQFPFR